ncbi:MAG: S-layer homology domain-containing protein [Clostridia bacterium]|nr:S-layer homology domain-containing protein [Clostridia bacterium]
MFRKHSMYYITIMALVTLFFLPGTALAQEPLASYTGPEGVTIKAFSKNWANEDKLKRIYDELVSNTHGDELSYLGSVNFYGGYPLGEGVAGMYRGYYGNRSDGRKTYNKSSAIDLYGGDGKSAVDDFAKVIAHEYGHHFTNYYLWMKEGVSFDDWRKTGYARVRGLLDEQRVSVQSNDHRWNIEEIAAEDYIQLFGSPLAKKSRVFKDQYGEFDNGIFNLSPQENLNLPLAAQVQGLEQYWLELAGLKGTPNAAPSSPALALVGVDKGRNGHLKLEFNWTRALDDNSPNLEYTLVYYAPDQPLAAPVKTLVDGYGASAIINGETGDRIFRVFVKDSKGKLVSSNIVNVDLSNPVVGQVPAASLFMDVGVDFWAYGEIKNLVEQGLVKGYAGNIFRPGRSVSRGEFATLLVRALKLPEGNGAAFTDTRSHWAAAAIEAARAAGIINGYQDDTFKPDRPVTRGELAAMLVKALKLSANGGDEGMNDTSGHWAAVEIAAARENGLVSGYKDGTFKPDATANRAEAVVMLKRMMDKLQ